MESNNIAVYTRLLKADVSDIDWLINKRRYKDRSDFVRDAVRDKLESLRLSGILNRKEHRGIHMSETIPDEILEHMPKSFQIFHEIEQRVIKGLIKDGKKNSG